uniref:CS domain-containing protein n=1 Tax=Schistocephalus solidus TaxID=70667 RepID=A0A0X3P1N3_SCHSO
MSGDAAFEEPTYSFNEQAKNVLRVVVKIPGMRSSAVLRFKNFLPQMDREVDNGRAQVNFQTRGFSFCFFGSGELQGKRYCLTVKDLPNDILPAKCNCEPHDGEFFILLKKAVPGSWMNALVEGLKTAPPDELHGDSSTIPCS